ncbi:unnamed protein product [Triticum turgidum subsp. durum]|uniref:DUF641 domain-containing protein n=1 Tax=Triticum turgidum subsp. durum TaxID=4567 RepID=A0A9R0XZL1_TRITD|nr:unnamed protein product [Triticum turgidum subsp. durum]
MGSMIGRIFNNISSLKAAYIQLQEAHTPYDPDKIQTADKLVIDELTSLSELKHTYRERNPKPVAASPQDSRLLSEIQEQQNLLKTYEVMVKKFQSQIQNRDTEIIHLQQQTDEAKHRKTKLEKKLKQRGLLNKESEESDEEESYFSVELTPSLFTSTADNAYQSIHEFSKPLINMMKAAGWDLDAAANAIEPDVVYTRRAHKKYAFESYICQRIFSGFHQENFSIDAANATVSNEAFFHQFLAVRAMDPLDVLSQNPDSVFGFFLRQYGSEKLRHEWRASKDTFLSGISQVGEVHMVVAQAGLLFRPKGQGLPSEEGKRVLGDSHGKCCEEHHLG